MCVTLPCARPVCAEYVLDALVRMSTDPVEKYGLSYKTMEQEEENVFTVCRLANRLTKHILRDNGQNCLAMLHGGFIRAYKDQIGFGLQARLPCTLHIKH